MTTKKKQDNDEQGDDESRDGVDPVTPNGMHDMALLPVQGSDPITPMQTEMDLQIQKSAEIDGIFMGVLTDGTPFLTGRGLARLCGVSNARISEIGTDWGSDSPKPVTARVRELLESRGVPIPLHPYIAIKHLN